MRLSGELLSVAVIRIHTVSSSIALMALGADCRFYRVGLPIEDRLPRRQVAREDLERRPKPPSAFIGKPFDGLRRRHGEEGQRRLDDLSRSVPLADLDSARAVTAAAATPKPRESRRKPACA